MEAQMCFTEEVTINTEVTRRTRQHCILPEFHLQFHLVANMSRHFNKHEKGDQNPMATELDEKAISSRTTSANRTRRPDSYRSKNSENTDSHRSRKSESHQSRKPDSHRSCISDSYRSEMSGSLTSRKSNSYRSGMSDSDRFKEVPSRSPVSRGYPRECTDLSEFTNDNKAVRMRTAHLRWLQDNNVYMNNSMKAWQRSLREHRPSNSARYPIRMTTPKLPIDPEWDFNDFRVHIYHSSRDGLWVKEWLLGMLSVRRFQVTTNRQPCEDCDRVIVVLSARLLRTRLAEEALESMKGRLALVVRLVECTNYSTLILVGTSRLGGPISRVH
ncbi:uncharacterized protein LOC116619146 isoform X2 [Nematostella vectensis]|uniref:uncharacterized protein LOC116619146 isoform X2 n=1 Tax=Nematostella vectensis TaxID=45351 RepID=UPI0020776D42|nr:uncharacterized protein LOC116619146 isoform X2 [Nematostella vectensis]